VSSESANFDARQLKTNPFVSWELTVCLPPFAKYAKNGAPALGEVRTTNRNDLRPSSLSRTNKLFGFAWRLLDTASPRDQPSK
jgi:hypothetical protein